MEEIIDKVIEIDKFAKQYMKTAEHRKANLENYIEQQKIYLKNQSEATLINDLEKEKNKLRLQTEAKIAQIKENEQQELDKLDNFINQNKENLVQKIYDEILNK